MEALDFFRQFAFTQHGPLMEGPPITGLLTQFDELKSQAANDREGEKKEPEKLAETLPEQGQRIRLGIIEGIRVDHEGKRNRDQRSLFRGSRQGHQRVKVVTVHAPQW